MVAISPINSKKTNWKNITFGIYCFSTVFIILFSIEAIHNWPPLLKNLSVLIACILPPGMFILTETPNWIKKKGIPAEIKWVLLICILSVISSLLSQHPWASLKSTILFIFSGPLVFITTQYLLKPLNNREKFLSMTSLSLLAISIFGIYEHFFSDQILLFSRNPLPAGAILLILSAFPMILLSRGFFSPIKLLYGLSLFICVVLIFLLDKKGPALGLLFLVSYLIFQFCSKKIRLLLIFSLFAGLTVCFLPPKFSDLKCAIDLKCIENSSLDSSESTPAKDILGPKLSTSLLFRAENYFLGFKIFKENSLFGIGFNANFAPYLATYDSQITKIKPEMDFHSYFKINQTFENIFLAFLIQFGGLFTITYFGGLFYLSKRSINKKVLINLQTRKEISLTTGAIIGFIVISLTFDTLRFPNLNWAFHSLLGLMVNLIPEKV
jgi:hypothetical protein